jgi:hypothetical protein
MVAMMESTLGMVPKESRAERCSAETGTARIGGS